MTVNTFFIDATAVPRTYYEGFSDINTDEKIHQHYFTAPSESGLVAGVSASVMFTVDKPARDVWPIISDFNIWQREFDHVYSGVLAQLEGKTFSLGIKRAPTDPPRPHYYEMVKVIPEHLLVINQPVPKDGTTAGFPGIPGVSPGFHIFMLNEHGDQTTISIYMEHAACAGTSDVQQAIEPWKKLVPEWQRKWREDFIRALKKSIREGR